MDLQDFGAELGGDLPLPNLGRVSRRVTDRLNDSGAWVRSWFSDAPDPDADTEAQRQMEEEAKATELVRTTASPPNRRKRLGLPQTATDDECEEAEKLDDIGAMALGAPATGGGRTKKKKRTKKRTKKRSKKRTKKKRSKKR